MYSNHISFFFIEVRANTTRRGLTSAPNNFLHAISQRLPDTMILAWKFSQLDSDSDRLVNSDELFVSHMKKVFGRIRRGRKCSKKLVISCDFDRNGGLSLGEWRKCLRKKNPKSTSSVSSSFRPGTFCS